MSSTLFSTDLARASNPASGFSLTLNRADLEKLSKAAGIEPERLGIVYIDSVGRAEAPALRFEVTDKTEGLGMKAGNPPPRSRFYKQSNKTFEGGHAWRAQLYRPGAGRHWGAPVEPFNTVQCRVFLTRSDKYVPVWSDWGLLLMVQLPAERPAATLRRKREAAKPSQESPAVEQPAELPPPPGREKWPSVTVELSGSFFSVPLNEVLDLVGNWSEKGYRTTLPGESVREKDS